MNPWLLLVALLFLVAFGACVPSVEIPEPPDMQPLLSAYAEPTAEVGSDLMAEWADPIVETQQAIEETSVPEQLLTLVEELQAELDASADGEAVIMMDGTPVSEPTGVIRLHHVCSGWGEEAEARDPAVDGTIDLTLTLQGGSIQPVVWGIFDGCRWKQTSGERTVEAGYDGEIRAYFETPFRPDTVIRDRVITFGVTGVVMVDGAERPLRRSFRLALYGARRILGGRLDILVETGDREYFVFFFRSRDFAVGLHDATGRYSCSLEERRCDGPSRTFSW